MVSALQQLCNIFCNKMECAPRIAVNIQDLNEVAPLAMSLDNPSLQCKITEVHMAYTGMESTSERVTVQRNRRAMIPTTDYVPSISLSGIYLIEFLRIFRMK